MNSNSKMLLIVCIGYCAFYSAQNERSQWHFGYQVGMNFLVNPPSIITSSANGPAANVSISDVNGSLLFYSNGQEVRTSTHVQMANGTGLSGDPSTCQGAIAIRRPGSSALFYLFTLGQGSTTVGLQYSIVDMALAGGQGSVTVTNIPVYNPCAELMCVAKHCNGIDYWVITHEYNSNNFRSYLFTANGLSVNPIISSQGPVFTGTVSNFSGHKNYQALVKLSPNARKIAALNSGLGKVLLGDFDATNGSITNLNVLDSTLGNPIGLEFSPDGSKLYASRLTPTLSSEILQWDLCSGPFPAIIASKTVIANNPQFGSYNGLELAIDDKIYVIQGWQNALACISNPNLASSACNFQNALYVFTPPKGVASFFPQDYRPFKQPKPDPFTHTVNCSAVNFTGIALTNTMFSSCSSSSYSIVSQKWDFGEPQSAGSNTSAVINPNHLYSLPGTYTVKLVLNYLCSSDSIIDTITILKASPQFSISGKSSICKNEKTTLSASGNYSYSWSSGGSSSTATFSPVGNSVYSVTATAANLCQHTSTVQITVNLCSGIQNQEEIVGIRVFPNPAQSLLHITTMESKINYKIFNLTGSIVQLGEAQKSTFEINVSELLDGIYILRVNEVAVKFIKQCTQ